jgi:cytochrome c biogenesis protein CcmG/thiol:disulfide interchange protein DsbE
MIKRLPVLIFLVFFAFLAKSLFQDQTEIPSPLIGKPIPTFSLPRLNAEGLVSDKDIVGKISLINVWATWCVGCLEEHQLLIKLSQGPMAIPIIGINWKDQTDSAIRWLEERGNPYTQIAVDYEGKTAIDFGVYGAPETFLIDDNGVIHYKHIGALTVDVWAQKFLPIINELKQ